MSEVSHRHRRDPFVPCFTGKAQRFARNTASHVPDSILPLNLTLQALSDRYVVAAFDKASFALYSMYRRSGQSYNTWISGFETEVAADAQWQKLFAEYPILETEIDALEYILADMWDELNGRLTQDIDRIHRYFGIGQGCRITKIDLTLSDPHHGHRTVAKIEFSCGTTIFYKPRSLTVDHCWQTVLGQSGQFPNVLFADTLCMHGYGYQAKLPSYATPRMNQDTARAAGEMLAIAWLLNSCDLHFDNVAFHGSSIGIFDLETILTPIMNYNANHEFLWRETNINSTLFFCTDVSQASAHFKSSAMAGLMRQGPIHDDLFFRYVGNGEVRPRSSVVQNGIVGQLRPNEALVRQMCTRFTQTSRDAAKKNALLDFIDSISDTDIRFVPRDTTEYYKIGLEMNLPKYLRQPELRSQYFEERISEAHRFDQQFRGSKSKLLVEDEFRQIMAGDIPIFAFKADQTDLVLSDKQKIDVFAVSALEHAKSKLRQAGDEDIREQSELISATFGYPFQISKTPQKQKKSSAQTCYDDLDIVAKRIVEEAVRPTGSPARWFSVSSGVPPFGSFASFGDQSGFKGSLGILRALEAYNMCAVGSSNGALVDEFLDREAAMFKFVATPVGEGISSKNIGFEGLAGNLQSAYHLMQLNPKRWCALTDYVHALLEELIEATPNITELDVISGLSGAILTLNNVKEFSPTIAGEILPAFCVLSKRFVEICTERTNNFAQPHSSQLFDDIGFAHGISGAFAAASCLGKGAQKTDPACLVSDYLAESLRETRMAYGYWPDLRLENAQKLNLSWCNGSVGLARALSVDDQFESFSGTLISEIWSDSLTGNIFELGARFCCGAASLLDLAIDTAQSGAIPTNQIPIANLENKLLSHTIKELSDDQFDRAFERHTANLYYGKSGVLYTALRSRYRQLPSLSVVPNTFK